MRYYFEITKSNGEKRLIEALTLQDAIRRKNNYRRSPYFKGAYLSKIFSTIEHNRFSLGDLARFKVK